MTVGNVTARGGWGRWALALVCAALLCASVSPAAAAKRVVVLGFDGPQGGRAQSMVTRIVKGKFTLVSAKTYLRAKKRLRAKSSDRDTAKVLQSIGADALVTGAFKRKGARWQLRVTVRDGDDGKVVASVSETMRRPAEIDGKRRKVSARLVSAIKRSGPEVTNLATKTPPKPKPESETETETETESETETETETETGTETESATKIKTKGGGNAGTETETETEGSDEDLATIAKAEREAEREAALADGGDGNQIAGAGEVVKKRNWRDGPPSSVRLSAGMSFIGRQFAFANTRTQLPSYKGVPTPAGLFDAELFPLALAGGGPLKGLGFGLVFERVITMHTEDADVPGLEIPTHRQRLEADMRYRIQTKNRATKPSVLVRVGYGSHFFYIEDYDPDMDGRTNRKLPNVTYTYALGGVGARVPLAGPLFSISLDAAYLAVLSAGPIARPTSYGGGFVGGIDGELGIEVRPTKAIVFRVGGRYTRFFYDFDGSGTLSDQDGNMQQDVGGALDQYYGGFFTFGYVR